MVNIGESGWTDERVDILKALWSQGLSAGDIAKELGGVTRNGVIGKVHRLNLSGRVKPRPQRLASAATPPRSAYRPSRVAADAGFGGFCRYQSSAAALKPPREIEHAEPSCDVVSFSDRKTMLQLENKHCRWPVGDPRSPDFFYCGGSAEEGQSYCAYHFRLAYQPRADRRRQGARQ